MTAHLANAVPYVTSSGLVRTSRIGDTIGFVRRLRHREWRGECVACHAEVLGTTRVAVARLLFEHREASS